MIISSPEWHLPQWQPPIRWCECRYASILMIAAHALVSLVRVFSIALQALALLRKNATSTVRYITQQKTAKNQYHGLYFSI
jgi:hypothetical protein